MLFLSCFSTFRHDAKTFECWKQIGPSLFRDPAVFSQNNSLLFCRILQPGGLFAKIALKLANTSQGQFNYFIVKEI